MFRSSHNRVSTTIRGDATDLIVPTDCDGDGKDDLAIFKDETWFADESTARRREELNECDPENGKSNAV